MARGSCSGRIAALLGVAVFSVAFSQAPSKRPITAADAIEMTVIAAPDSHQELDWRTGYFHFSPDAERFVIVLKQGNLKRNVNNFSLSLYRTANAARSPKPNVILTMSSSSNRDAISNVRWITNTTLTFLGENPGELPQIYALDTATRHLEKLTDHRDPIVQYDISRDGNTIVYIADRPRAKPDSGQIQRDGAVITNASLYGVLRGEYAAASFGEQLFVQERGKPLVQLPVAHVVAPFSPPLLSPDGRYALVDGELLLRNLPASWDGYNFGKYDDYVRSFFKSANGSATGPFAQHLLVDVRKHVVAPLLDAPIRVGETPREVWALDGKSVLVTATYLPLDVQDAVERELRKRNGYDVEVKIPSGEYQKIPQNAFPSNGGVKLPIRVRIEDDINNRSKIYVYNSETNNKVMLLDLNPQFKDLSFGRVETIRWSTTNGHEYIGGIHLPPDFVRGKKYPLVVQTHGYHPDAFTMDGIGEWNSGYAARFLAAQGFVVLQSGGPADNDLGLSNGKYTSAQFQKHTEAAAYQSAVEYLAGRGLIDKSRVGIMGFSRTVCYVGYTLTHSNFQFAAAILVDGIDCGYFQYLTEGGGNPDAETLNGGSPPWGKGLPAWLEEAPGFSLDKVHVPIRLEAHGKGYGDESLLEQWEWFSALKTLQKPVDFVLLPDADHRLVKPWERMVSQQGAVDWYRFWLQGYEDPDLAKAEQYRRWERLCDMQRTGNPNRPTFCVRTVH